MCLPTCHFFESPPLSRELSPEMLQLIFQMKRYRRKKRHGAQGKDRPRISKPAYNQTTIGPTTQVFQENSEDVTPYMQNNKALQRLLCHRAWCLRATTAFLWNGLPPQLNIVWFAGAAQSRLTRHPVFDLSSHCHESLLHIRGILCTRFQKGNSNLVSEGLCSRIVDHLLRCEIRLVTNEQLINILTSVTIDFVQPLLHVIEAFLIRDIIHNNNTMGTTVVTASDCPESFLTGGVPNLQFDGLPVQLHRPNFEINANRADVALQIGIIRKPQQKATLSDT